VGADSTSLTRQKPHNVHNGIFACEFEPPKRKVVLRELSAITKYLQKLVERAGIEAGMPFKCRPHMLRHATGYALANKGTDTRTLQAYLGHRSIQSTVHYSEMAPGRFKNIWKAWSWRTFAST
jgi:site-specific recombinase XerD